MKLPKCVVLYSRKYTNNLRIESFAPLKVLCTSMGHRLKPRVVIAARFIRRMRGRSQAHLLEGDDGMYYVTKFQENPQGRRILVNELLSWFILERLGFAVPEAVLVHVTQDFLLANPGVCVEVHGHRRTITPGHHFGSALAANPASEPVYDFLPDTLLNCVQNLCEAIGVFAFDRWVANCDFRQLVFLRSNAYASDVSRGPGYLCRVIDHGQAFNGSEWNYCQQSLSALYPRRVLYQGVRSIEDFQPWLDMVTGFPEELLWHAVSQLPEEWLCKGERRQLELMVAKLIDRRKRVQCLVTSVCATQPSVFPNWSPKRRAVVPGVTGGDVRTATPAPIKPT